MAPVELNRRKGGQGGGVGAGVGTVQRYVQAIVVNPPLSKLPLSECLHLQSCFEPIV